jgi:hypothetical protein
MNVSRPAGDFADVQLDQAVRQSGNRKHPADAKLEDSPCLQIIDLSVEKRVRHARNSYLFSNLQMRLLAEVRGPELL